MQISTKTGVVQAMLTSLLMFPKRIAWQALEQQYRTICGDLARRIAVMSELGTCRGAGREAAPLTAGSCNFADRAGRNCCIGETPALSSSAVLDIFAQRREYQRDRGGA